MKKYNWIIEGLIFGALMLIFNGFIEYISDDFTFDRFWLRILIYMLGGLGFGFTMKLVRGNSSPD